LAQVAAKRFDEMQDPELSIDRALEQYLHFGIQKTGSTNDLKALKYEKS
jgi:hypothetical protein